MSDVDHGMLFIPKLHLITKIHQNADGFEYVHLPKHGKKKFYLGDPQKNDLKQHELDEFMVVIKEKPMSWLKPEEEAKRRETTRARWRNRLIE